MATKLSLADALGRYTREELDRLVASGDVIAEALLPPDHTRRERLDPELFRQLEVLDRRRGIMAGGHWDLHSYDGDLRYAVELREARREGLPDSAVEPQAPPDFVPDPDLPRYRGVTITMKARALTRAIRMKTRKLLDDLVRSPKPGTNRELARTLADRITEEIGQTVDIDADGKPFKADLAAALAAAGDAVDRTWTKYHRKDPRRDTGPSR